MENIIVNRDLTNPRDLYTLLSGRTKSLDGLPLKLEIELSQTGPIPITNHALTNDTDQPMVNAWRLGNKLSHVDTVDHNQKNLDMLIFNRHTACKEDLNQSEENKETRGTVHLPKLSQQVKHSEANNRVDGRAEAENVLVELPLLPKTRTMANGKVHSRQQLTKDGTNLLRVRSEFSVSDSKLHKWFAEMPNEVFDKAQRALMEESIKDKLGEYQRNQNRKVNFPNQSVHVWLGSSMKKVPNIYLELKVDSLGRNAFSDDKLMKYKLQQKSLHNLKMREMTETDRLPVPREDPAIPRMALQHRSLTTLALSKSKSKTDKMTKDDKDVIKIPTERGLTQVYLNDTFEPVETNLRVKQRHSVSNFEDYREKVIMKEAQDFQRARSDKSRMDSPPPNTMIGGFDLSNTSSHERDTTKAAIVNLSLKKEVPRPRMPMGLDKPTREFIPETHKSSTFLGKSDKSAPKKLNTSVDEIDGTKVNDMNEDTTKNHTNQSSKTSESKSSSNSHQSQNKLVLKKFNTLEVFADNSKVPQIAPRKDGFKESKLRSSEGLRGIPVSQSMKLDIRQHGWSGSHTQREQLLILPNNEVKKQDFVFRFEPEEVFVTRKDGNRMQNHTRSSERARVIYGKIVNQHKDWNDRRDPLHRSKEDLRESNSLLNSSRRGDMNMLGAGSRTMVEGGSKGLSSMAEQPTDSLDDFMTGYTKRDASTETDGEGSAMMRKGVPDRPVNSEMSGYIVEDNDGASLTSETADKTQGKKSGRSGGYSV